MNHIEIYKNYKEIFPEVVPSVDDWFPNGKNSIRVRIKNGSDFIFTYNANDDWRYETIVSHIRKMRGGVNVVC